MALRQRTVGTSYLPTGLCAQLRRCTTYLPKALRPLTITDYNGAILNALATSPGYYALRRIQLVVHDSRTSVLALFLLQARVTFLAQLKADKAQRTKRESAHCVHGAERRQLGGAGAHRSPHALPLLLAFRTTASDIACCTVSWLLVIPYVSGRNASNSAWWSLALRGLRRGRRRHVDGMDNHGLARVRRTNKKMRAGGVSRRRDQYPPRVE